MRTPTNARIALALALILTLGTSARSEEDPDAPPADPEAATAQGFPWLCFAITVGSLAGLYVLVRRREQAIESVPTTAAAWYCRACDRDVDGPDCPKCGAANPFLEDPVSATSLHSSRHRRAADD